MLSKEKLTQQSFDRIATAYAREYYNELKEKPFDRDMLSQYTQAVKRKARICEIGCGPGEIGRFLWEQGLIVYGLDLSRGMLKCAKDLNPGMIFLQGEMSRLPFADRSLDGVIAFYSLNHAYRENVWRVLFEINRVLVQDGLLLLALHLGEGQLHTDEWFGFQVSIDTIFFSLDEITKMVSTSGFYVEDSIERKPYSIEWENQRGYVLARKITSKS